MKRMLITGATSGIGRRTAVELAASGHHIGVHGRTASKVCEVVDEITSAGGSADVFVADLASLEQTSRLAAEVLGRWQTLDVLVNNAGLVMTERQTTHDGHEMTWGVNHLSHYLLTRCLQEHIGASGGRVVHVASDAHYGAKVPFDDLEAEHSFSGWSRYQSSKLMNILFSNELARRFPELVSVSLHPGFVASQFGMNTGWMSWIMRLTRLVQLSVEDGAKTSVWCAQTDDVVSGEYYAKQRAKAPSGRARDEHAAARLWDVSEAAVSDWL